MRRHRLVLALEHRRRLEAAAREAAPEECCGILLGRYPATGLGLVTRVVETENVTAGDRERSYEIAPSEVVAAWRLAGAAGERILGFYHSHPGGRGWPSAHDALGAWDGMSYLIVTPREETCELSSWRRERAEPLPADPALVREEVREAGHAGTSA
jgi:proteasome lid subunit RPN8/RPN11